MQKLLYGKTFGLGNCVMAVPAIKSFADMFGPIDVLIGSTRDDPGAFDVMNELRATHGCINEIFVDRVPLDRTYEYAVMAIPFDGRWQNNVHFCAICTLDGRPRPGDPTRLGLESWQIHEVEYQMENVFNLGKHLGIENGPVPSMRFAYFERECDPDLVYLGIGFKRDTNGFWSKKHWGNERFARFVREVRRLRPQTNFISSAGQADMTVAPDIVRQCGVPIKYGHIRDAFKVIAEAGSYFGNDTGTAHVAASFDRPTYMMTAFPGSEVKNSPWCSKWKCNPFHTEVMEPESVAKDFIDFVWGQT